MKDPHLTANSEAAKLVRKRRRHAKLFVQLCRRIQELDCRLIGTFVHCTPAAREEIREQLTNQEARMLDAVAQEGPSPLSTLTRYATTTRQIQTTTA